MDTESDNVNVANFLPASANKKGIKRAISDEVGQMQVDEVEGIEGTVKTNTPKSKKRKQNNTELRKIPVPPHRYFVQNSYSYS